MTRPVAVKTFLEEDSVRGKIGAGEFMAFWKECDEATRIEFSEQAARELGLELAV